MGVTMSVKGVLETGAGILALRFYLTQTASANTLQSTPSYNALLPQDCTCGMHKAILTLGLKTFSLVQNYQCKLMQNLLFCSIN